MRLEIAFVRPLSPEDRIRVSLAVAALAKVDRIRFIRGDRMAVVFGEALAAARLQEALAETGVAIESVTSPLDTADDHQLDDVPGAPGVERVRAIGR